MKAGRLKDVAIWLVIVALLTMFIPPVQYTHAETEIDGNFEYRVDDHGQAHITAYHGSSTSVHIPQFIGEDNLLVVGIDNRAFQGKGITEITFPDSLQSIGDNAFGANNIQRLTIPSSVTYIGKNAFMAAKISELIIEDGDNPLNIDNSAFTFNQIDNLTLNRVTRIGGSAFSNNQIKKLTIPYGIKKIEVNSFAVNKIEELTLPDSVTTIEENAFAGNKIKELTLPGSVTIIDRNAFSNNEITELTLPDSVTTINYNAFGSNKLSNITIPASVTKIDDYAFNGNLLVYAILENPEVQISDINPFGYFPTSYAPQLTLIGYKGSTAETYANRYSDKIMFKDIQHAPEVEYDITKHQSDIYATIKRYKGTKTDITIPSRLGYVKITKIGEKAFEGKQLNSVTILDKSMEIGSNAFANNQENPEDFKIFGYVGSPAETYANENGHTFIDIEEERPDLVFDWEDNKDGTATITGYNGTKKNLVIPSEIQGLTVKKIGKSAFTNKGLTSVSIPDTVESIGQYAFTYNDFTSMTIPDSVTSIEEYAFQNNKNLKTVYLGENLRTIGDFAFQHCAIEELHFHPQGKLARIGTNAFHNNQLTKLEIPKSVTEISAYAFLNNRLSEVTIHNPSTNILYSTDPVNPKTFDPFEGNQDNPEDLTIIGYKNSTAKTYASHFGYTFISIEQLEAEKEFEWVDNEDGTATITGYKGNKTNIEIPQNLKGLTVTAIADEAFKDSENNIKLTSVTIPNSVKSIGDRAFQGNQITSVQLGSVESIGEHAFSGNRLTNVTIPNTVKSIGKYAFHHNQIAKVEFGNQLETIGEGAFANNSIEVAVLPENIQNVGKNAFSHNRLYTVEVHNENTVFDSEVFSDNQENAKELYIGGYESSTAKDYAAQYEYTFYHLERNQWFTLDKNNSDATAVITKYTGNSQIEELIIPKFIDGYKIIKIEQLAFHQPTFKKVVIPNTVTHIGNSAFSIPYGGTKVIEEVVMGENIIYIGESAFSGNKIKNINIPDSVEEIKSLAFANNDLRSVTLGKRLTKIESSVFANNPNLKKIVIPDNITEIENSAFASCRLEEVVFSKNLTSIGERAFYDHRLTKIDIPNSVVTIGKEAFGSNIFNGPLEEVNLGNSVKIIGEGAFIKNSIRKIKIPYTVEQIGKNAFASNQLEEVTLGVNVENGVTKGVKIIEDGAFRFNKIEKLNIPDTVEQIGNYAFDNNTLLNSVDLGNGVKRIGNEAFAYTAVRNITLPASLESIGNRAFYGSAISSVIVWNKELSFGTDLFKKPVPTPVKMIGYDLSTAKEYAIANGHEFINGEGEVTFSSNGNTEWKQSHSVSIQVKGYDESKPLEYAWSTSKDTPTEGWQAMNKGSIDVSTPESKTGQYYLHVRGTSLLGLEIYARTNAFYVDNTPPSVIITPSITEITHDDVILTVTAEDHESGVKRIQTPDNKWHDESMIEYTVLENGTYQFVVEDNAGNAMSKEIRIDNIDTSLAIEEIPLISDNETFALKEQYPTHRLNMTSFLKVKDWRKGNNNQWRIEVRASRLKMKNGSHVLSEGTIQLKPLENSVMLEGDGQLPELKMKEYQTFAIDSGSVILAEGNGSRGVYQLEFPDHAIELWVDPSKTIIDNLSGTIYETTIEWNLVTGP